MKNILLICVGLMFVGCTKEECKPEIQTIYKTETIVKTIPCPTIKVDCDFKGEQFVPTKKLLDCVILQKRALELCNKESIVSH